ncbi:hypothetical protein E4U43_005307 [Claviceps pusilla]|uniref:F-box domain-containing protein n=1 Tax=Claviceps pusilla TaxID=123648 RepID=A0A9P7N281_9HYPO|nr:hypothetical protein E4U43_005307 [Claviceps pusilla]
MARKSIPVMEWAMTHSSVVFDDEYDPAKTSPTSRRRGSQSQCGSASRDQRFRSLSMSLPWKKSKHSLFGHDDHRSLAQQMQDTAVDDTCEDDSEYHHAGQNSNKGNRRPHGSIKGIIRRASMSFKGFVHRRPSLAAESIQEQTTCQDERPTTSHASCGRSRHATTGFHHTCSIFDNHDMHHEAHYLHFPVPGQGDEPPVIPQHTGAAAKASAAMQNEFYARQRWLAAASSEDGNDGESGIGIAVTRSSSIDLESARCDSIFEQDPNISRVDFISLLPTELAIHVLANLDAPALARSSCVSRRWHDVIINQHIWRESCLREITVTYATSQPIQPDTGLGIPKICPGVDWKKVYQATMQLSRRWKEGRAQPVYLNGHTDSIYCLQFDE